MYLSVRNAGMFTSVRENGKIGMQQFGFAPGGAADLCSFHQANFLVGNEEGRGALECTFLGPHLVFNSPALIAVTGADMRPELNGLPVEMYKPVYVGKGWELDLSAAVCGCRTYIAVRGGLGEETGICLKTGDVLELPEPDGTEKAAQERKDKKIPEDKRVLFKQKRPVILRAVRGPQADAFTKEGYQEFYHTEYAVTEQSNRMGIRMSGKAVPVKTSADIISDGIPAGAVQISSSGQPIVMMNDRQTVGGYAKIAVVISTDMPELAQLCPGDTVCFREISVKEANRIRKKRGRI